MTLREDTIEMQKWKNIILRINPPIILAVLNGIKNLNHHWLNLRLALGQSLLHILLVRLSKVRQDCCDLILMTNPSIIRNSAYYVNLNFQMRHEAYISIRYN